MKPLAQKAETELAAAGITVFPSIGRAALALSRFTRYHAKRAMKNPAGAR